ncbi:1-phosphofructokinase [hydrothermal vent metagenome]|uniref:1-phosphofructokinase n=1 Tax=hydrothermal vent metagenome TaxID=652676 RepID=A0A3B1CDJ1_9ZZZZ
MILTVTLNPLLENRLYFDSIDLGKSNRSTSHEFKAGGKGINVSRQLNHLGIKNIALTFLGGNNGKALRKIMAEEEINLTAISTKSETRAATLIVETNPKRLTTFFEPNRVISQSEVDQFKSKLEKMIQNCSIVVFSGSTPCVEADDIFSFGIDMANRLDKMSILDTYGSHMKSCINAVPTILHNNVSEVEKSLSVDLSTEKNKTNFLKELYQKGIKLAFLTDGNNPTYASKFDFVYKIDSPSVDEVDSTGSGDAFVAGIAHGIEKALIFNEFAKNAVALGALNASKWGVCTSTLEETEKLIRQITVTSIGKKLKLIDDSPTY